MLGRFVRRLVRWIVVGAIIAASVGYYLVNNTSHYPPRWHKDPTFAQRSATGNDYLAAPAGTTAAPADLETEVYPETPLGLLTRFDAVVRARPRVEVIAGGLDEMMITYMQRSPYVGFPDYITVRAVPVGEGASLIIYSRSRYGRSDLGVNAKRVTDWLSEIGLST